MGDIHGCAELFERLLKDVFRDAAKTDNYLGRPVLVLLGDYLDRGPRSCQVLDLIINLQRQSTFQVTALRGNHEAALLNFLDDPQAGIAWLDHGGAATLLSYGVSPPLSQSRSTLSAVHDAFHRAFPAEHLALLQNLPLCAVLGDYAFVHAGVRPMIELERQSDEDLLWIREPFLSHPRPLPQVVVHGHTPAREPFDGEARIGIDTGAFATGVLTAVRLLGGDRRFLQVRGAS